ncbi:MAG: hypothetical protein ACI805_002859, partial [Candidatus Azotimanducaceae bacterium]
SNSETLWWKVTSFFARHSNMETFQAENRRWARVGEIVEEF